MTIIRQFFTSIWKKVINFFPPVHFLLHDTVDDQFVSTSTTNSNGTSNGIVPKDNRSIQSRDNKSNMLTVDHYGREGGDNELDNIHSI
jgi:hypothetical protein